jgi:hypothetical protein
MTRSNFEAAGVEGSDRSAFSCRLLTLEVMSLRSLPSRIRASRPNVEYRQSALRLEHGGWPTRPAVSTAADSRT